MYLLLIKIGYCFRGPSAWGGILRVLDGRGRASATAARAKKPPEGDWRSEGGTSGCGEHQEKTTQTAAEGSQTEKKGAAWTSTWGRTFRRGWVFSLSESDPLGVCRLHRLRWLGTVQSNLRSRSAMGHPNHKMKGPPTQTIELDRAAEQEGRKFI